MKILNKYINGNATITIWDDGTRETNWPDGELLDLEYPLSIDLCITKYCDRGCPFCYAGCTTSGKHADIMNLKFIDSMIPGEEIAIGGGSATSHPDLKPFLIKLKDKGLIANMTVSQGEFIDNLNLINNLIEENLIHGLGISYKEPNDLLWKMIGENEDCIVHLIAGIHDKSTFDYLTKFGVKVLILGYKDIDRGKEYHEIRKSDIDEKISWAKSNINNYKNKFKVISFDNLAIKQLNIKNMVSEEEWNSIYQGSDGTISCYVNAIEQKAYISSLDEQKVELTDDIRVFFKQIKEISKNGK